MHIKIVERYSDNSEENRLFSDKTHMVEYLTTIYYFDKLLPKSTKVLDACAGTGVYSFWLSDNGFKVTAGDLVQSNVDMIISKQSNHNPLQEI